jgi:RHS repeat-associated protein
MSYYPYGEEKTSTADDREKFGTYTRDNVTQDYADQRYYAVGAGRFGTADPGGIKMAHSKNPTSWNRYMYVYGDPVNHTDRHGLNADDNTDGCEDEDPDMPCFSVTGYGGGDDGSGDDGIGDVGGAYDPCEYDPGGCGAPETTPVPDPQKNTKTGKKPKPKPKKPNCPAWAARFFDNLSLYQGMATQVRVNVDYIMALSALESHWDDTHAQDLGNLFGLTNGGGPNIDFRNGETLSAQAGYQASANYWVAHYGTLVTGATSISQFWQDLGNYNTKNPNYASTITDVYNSVVQRRKDCDR